MVGGGRPLLSEILGQTDRVEAKSPNFSRYTLVAPQQGWARDVKARDRDETETLTSRDGDVGFTSREETETRRL